MFKTNLTNWKEHSDNNVGHWQFFTTYSKWKLNVPLWGSKQTWHMETTTFCKLAELSILFSYTRGIHFFLQGSKEGFLMRDSGKVYSILGLYQISNVLNDSECEIEPFWN